VEEFWNVWRAALWCGIMVDGISTEMDSNRQVTEQLLLEEMRMSRQEFEDLNQA
jgi:hypothetical protein